MTESLVYRKPPKLSLLQRGLLFLMPAFRMIGFVFKPIGLAFAWHANRAWRREVRNALGFLFDEHGAQLVAVPKELQSPMATLAMVEIGTLRLVFGESRGEQFVNVAWTDVPENWYDFGMVLAAVRGVRRDAVPSMLSLEDVAEALREDLGQILRPPRDLAIRILDAEDAANASSKASYEKEHGVAEIRPEDREMIEKLQKSMKEDRSARRERVRNRAAEGR